MDNPAAQKFSVDLGTKHTVYEVSKGWYIFFWVIKFAIHFGIGVWLATLIYDKCLFNEKCNNVATTFFCLLSLACFVNCGLPINKVANGMIKVSD